MSCGEFLDTTSRRMQTQLKLVEGKRATDWNGQFAVGHETFRGDVLKLLDYVWEISRQGLAGFRLQKNPVPVAKRDAAKAVPLRFILPIVAHGNLIDGACLHGRERRF